MSPPVGASVHHFRCLQSPGEERHSSACAARHRQRGRFRQINAGVRDFLLIEALLRQVKRLW